LRKILCNELIEVTLVSAEADTPLKPTKVNFLSAFQITVVGVFPHVNRAPTAEFSTQIYFL